jgi:hypothetical protein
VCDDGVIEEVKKLLRGQNSNCYKKGISALFLTGARLLKLPEILYKNEVIHTSSYSMNMFKQLYNTLPGIEKCVAEIFGESCTLTL